LEVLAITRELAEGEFNDGMLHSWRPHEVLTIRQYCKSASLVAALYDTDIREPVASFEPRDGSEAYAIAAVTRSGDIYIMIDGDGELIRERKSLFDVLNEVH
jgi:hypothetical protein